MPPRSARSAASLTGCDRCDQLLELLRTARDPLSVRDMVHALGWSSTSVVTYHLKHLRNDGILDWQPGRARTYRLLVR